MANALPRNVTIGVLQDIVFGTKDGGEYTMNLPGIGVADVTSGRSSPDDVAAMAPKLLTFLRSMTPDDIKLINADTEKLAADLEDIIYSKEMPEKKRALAEKFMNDLTKVDPRIVATTKEIHAHAIGGGDDGLAGELEDTVVMQENRKPNMKLEPNAEDLDPAFRAPPGGFPNRLKTGPETHTLPNGEIAYEKGGDLRVKADPFAKRNMNSGPDIVPPNAEDLDPAFRAPPGGFPNRLKTGPETHTLPNGETAYEKGGDLRVKADPFAKRNMNSGPDIVPPNAEDLDPAFRAPPGGFPNRLKTGPETHTLPNGETAYEKGGDLRVKADPFAPRPYNPPEPQISAAYPAHNPVISPRLEEQMIATGDFNTPTIDVSKFEGTQFKNGDFKMSPELIQAARINAQLVLDGIKSGEFTPAQFPGLENARDLNKKHELSVDSVASYLIAQSMGSSTKSERGLDPSFTATFDNKIDKQDFKLTPDDAHKTDPKLVFEMARQIMGDNGMRDVIGGPTNTAKADAQFVQGAIGLAAENISQRC